MKKLIISIIAVSITGTISAGSFSMADYKAKTKGKAIVKVKKKEKQNIAKLIINAETSLQKLKIEYDDLELTEAMVKENFNKRLSKIMALKGDKKSALASLNTARKTKISGINREKVSLKNEIKGKKKLVKYYEKLDEVVRIERELRVAGILKSSASV